MYVRFQAEAVKLDGVQAVMHHDWPGIEANTPLLHPACKSLCWEPERPLPLQQKTAHKTPPKSPNP